MKIKIIILVFLFFKLLSSSYGWGKVGHTIVAEVAKSSLNKNIQDSVQKYFGDMTWGEAATWMDDIKSQHKYDNMKPWHYLNIEKGNVYADTIAQGNNVANQLEIAIKNLKNKSKLSKEEISFNLKILFHLMGDLHQPLHVGYGVDRGGNDIIVFFNGETTNLHHVWDSDIIEFGNISSTDIEKILSKTSAEKIKNTAKLNVVKWVTDSRKFLNDAYNVKDDTITDDYISKEKIVVATQLLKASIRLAAILQEVFSL